MESVRGCEDRQRGQGTVREEHGVRGDKSPQGQGREMAEHRT